MLRPRTDLNENWLSVKHSIEMEKEDVKVLKLALSSIRKERNKLVHHNTARHDLGTVAGCRKFCRRARSPERKNQVHALDPHGICKIEFGSQKDNDRIHGDRGVLEPFTRG